MSSIDVASTGLRSTDPELESLPEPRRPWRRVTLFTLGIVGTLALALMIALRHDVTYALMDGPPLKLGELGSFAPEAKFRNRWVQGTGELSTEVARYRRPLDPDRFRLAPLSDNRGVWVELREPSTSEQDSYIPPNSFVGRLVPLAQAGLAYSRLTDALRDSQQPFPPPDAWLLSDGSSPRSYQWLLGVVAVLVAIAGFCTFGLYHLAGPVRRRPTRLDEPRR